MSSFPFIEELKTNLKKTFFDNFLQHIWNDIGSY